MGLSEIEPTLAQLVPAGSLPVPDLEHAFLYGFAGGMIYNLPEPSGCAAVRVQFHGNLNIVCATASYITRYLKNISFFADANAPTYSELQFWLSSVDQEALDKAAAGGCKFFYGQLGASEALIMPAGFVVCVKTVNNNTHCCGIRKSFLCKSEQAHLELGALAELHCESHHSAEAKGFRKFAEVCKP